MESIVKDTRGQWIVLSGLVLALILVGIGALANQAIIAGYHSSNAALEFPKENIRELNSHTRDSSKIIKDLSFKLNETNNDTIPVIFEQLFENYSSQMEILYAMHGETVDMNLVSLNTTNGSYNRNDTYILMVNMTYDDGTTQYSSEPEVIEVKA